MGGLKHLPNQQQQQQQQQLQQQQQQQQQQRQQRQQQQQQRQQQKLWWRYLFALVLLLLCLCCRAHPWALATGEGPLRGGAPLGGLLDEKRISSFPVSLWLRSKGRCSSSNNSSSCCCSNSSSSSSRERLGLAAFVLLHKLGNPFNQQQKGAPSSSRGAPTQLWGRKRGSSSGSGGPVLEGAPRGPPWDRAQFLRGLKEHSRSRSSSSRSNSSSSSSSKSSSSSSTRINSSSSSSSGSSSSRSSSSRGSSSRSSSSSRSKAFCDCLFFPRPALLGDVKVAVRQPAAQGKQQQPQPQQQRQQEKQQKQQQKQQRVLQPLHAVASIRVLHSAALLVRPFEPETAAAVEAALRAAPGDFSVSLQQQQQQQQQEGGEKACPSFVVERNCSTRDWRLRLDEHAKQQKPPRSAFGDLPKAAAAAAIAAAIAAATAATAAAAVVQRQQEAVAKQHQQKLWQHLSSNNNSSSSTAVASAAAADGVFGWCG
ncbi:hypothetical protein Emed_002124 [Eimeria media]